MPVADLNILNWY